MVVVNFIGYQPVDDQLDNIYFTLMLDKTAQLAVEFANFEGSQGGQQQENLTSPISDILWQRGRNICVVSFLAARWRMRRS